MKFENYIKEAKNVTGKDIKKALGEIKKINKTLEKYSVLFDKYSINMGSPDYDLDEFDNPDEAESFMLDRQENFERWERITNSFNESIWNMQDFITEMEEIKKDLK